MATPHEAPSSSPAPRAQLSIWDTVSIIIGIVIGATIYETPGLVFGNVGGPGEGLLAWALGGGLTLIGALCYAELATTYPRSGGDYVYLTRAYGRRLGFLFGWAQLAALLSGSIGMMAYIFADHAVRLFDIGPHAEVTYAALAVILLALVNARGVAVGKRTQNLLTIAKILGLGGVLIAGLMAGGDPSGSSAQPEAGGDFGFAMIFVLLAYGGWNDIAFVAADVRDQQRNLPRALVIGTLAVVVIYMLVNLAYLSGLGFDGLRSSRTPAADVLGLVLGDWGVWGMSVLVMIAALGAVNGLTFVGSRLYSSLGTDHPLFARLGSWHENVGAPVFAIAVQAGICVLMILFVGTEMGLHAANGFLTSVGADPLASLGKGGFDILLKCTAPVFWGFFLLTAIALFVLRLREPTRPRPFSVPFYPVLPMIFCGMCLYMLRSAIDYAGNLTLIGLVPVLLGLPLYWISMRMSASKSQEPAE